MELKKSSNKIQNRIRLGVPQAMLYFEYAPFIDAFAAELPVDIVYSGETDMVKFSKGIEHCADDACLPIKVMCGHLEELHGKCDAVVLPRIMTCEYGQSFCPKTNGMPELLGKSHKYLFTKRLDLNNRQKLLREFKSECRKIGISGKSVESAFELGLKAWHDKGRERWCETEYDRVVFLAGHPYTISDAFINMNIIKKLHALGIGVITSGAVDRIYKEEYSKEFEKKPFWHYLTELYGAARFLEEKRIVSGIIFISSFSCGTDAVTAELVRHTVSLPFLLLKIDEHTGEAGFDTRIEAFAEVLETW